MSKIVLVLAFGAFGAAAQVKNYTPVTTEMLLNPPAGDWLMFSRTYDGQRFSPLNQINTGNVAQLRTAWTRGIGTGTLESIPLVHNGVMYVLGPSATILALDATDGELLWQYKREVPANIASQSRAKTLSIYDDVIVYTAPDSFVVGLDARTGERRWEAKTDTRGHTSGSIVVDGMAISAGTCNGLRANCYIAAHEAKTGKEVWKFYTAAGAGDPGDASWGGAPEDKRTASTWGLPGTYDPVRKLLYWGVANPTPNTRVVRHQGKVDAIAREAPADLYSNSTLAIHPDTGKLAWYYQHLPGDDWDEDYTHERILLHTKINPDSKFVKWANPEIPKGQEHDVAVMVGEGGGVFSLDRGTGQFLWATPFPFDVPNFVLKNIDPKTGKTFINDSLFFTEPGMHHVICFWNTRGYYPTAYSPSTNSLYVPYVDNCLDMTSAGPQGGERRFGVPRPGGKLDEFAGIAKIDMETGEMLRFNVGRAGSTGSVLATAGDLVFNGDVNRRFRAFDARTGKQLWESILGGPITVSTITYAVAGKQFVAVFTGDNLAAPGLAREAQLKPPTGHNAVYVFALP